MTDPAVDWEDVKKKRAALIVADDAASKAATEATEGSKRAREAQELAQDAQREFNEALWPKATVTA